MEKHPNPKLAIPAAIVIVAALAVAGYALVKMQADNDTSDSTVATSTSTPTATPTTVATTSPTITTSPTSSPSLYNTLRNSQYGFSFEYPKTWKLTYTIGNPSGGTYKVITENKDDSNVFDLDNQPTTISFYSEPTSSGTTLAEYVKGIASESSRVHEQSTKIGTYNAIKFDDGGGMFGTKTSYVTSYNLASTEGTVFMTISYSTGGGADKAVPADIQHIFSTLSLQRR